MILDTGVEIQKFRLLSGNTDVITHMNVGSGTIVPIRTQTALDSEYGTRFALGFDTTLAKVTAIGSIALSTNCGSPFSELAIFTQSTAGSTFNRVKFDTIIKEASGTRYTFEQDIQYS